VGTVVGCNRNTGDTKMQIIFIICLLLVISERFECFLASGIEFNQDLFLILTFAVVFNCNLHFERKFLLCFRVQYIVL